MATQELKGNAYGLNAMVELEATIVRDGGHNGTLFVRGESLDDWIVTDLDTLETQRVDRIAIVRPVGEIDPDDGLNQAAIGCDLDEGIYVVDEGDVAELTQTYANSIEVVVIL